MDLKLIQKKKLDKKRYFGPKEINRKKLNQQNLIFSVVTIIIIIILIVVVASSLTLLIKQINTSFKPGSPQGDIEQFDVSGFELIKDKIPGYIEPSLVPSPTVESMVIEASTTTDNIIPSSSPALEIPSEGSTEPIID